ncbi:hypothetical protein [Streptomyces sp. NPDC053367]|uniref:hypothetical protein n=1 Tax=Streptomyces sp. NPDC053367 TaxID=3365700 RepID=UPI0037D2EBE2
MSADDEGAPEFGAVRINDRGEAEFYDGAAWKRYADVAVPDWDELPVVRESPVIRPHAEDGPAGQDPADGRERG